MRSLIPFPWRNDVAGKDELDPFAAMQKEINRVFSEFGGQAPASWRGQALVPQIDVAETDSAVEVTADLPGLDEKDFEVVLQDDILTIKGEKKSEHEEKKRTSTWSSAASGASPGPSVCPSRRTRRP